MQLTPPEKPHAVYVERLRRRLARPAISVKDARDGVLDCFVATYQEGLAAGLEGVLGVEAGPDQVARIAAGIFRKRLANHGSSFEQPSIEALARVKEEADQELHFAKLPVEIQSTHDRVCELLLAKAEGSLPHAGDHSSVVGARVSASAITSVAPTSLIASPPARPASVALREAIASLLDEVGMAARNGRPMNEIDARLEKTRRLVETARELEAV
jgi:hypothetical protein